MMPKQLQKFTLPVPEKKSSEDNGLNTQIYLPA